MAGKFVITRGKDSKFYFALKAGNGEKILQSQGYADKRGCLNGVESVRKNAVEENASPGKSPRTDVSISPCWPPTASRSVAVRCTSRNPGATTASPASGAMPPRRPSSSNSTPPEHEPG